MATLSGITTYTHDAAGNRTRVDHPDGTADTFAWDARSQMTAATVGGNSVTMTYNAFRQRVSKVTSGETTLYHYDHKNLIHESEGIEGEYDELTKSYTGTNEEFGDLISEYDLEAEGGPTEFYHQFDAQYATNAMLDESGSVKQRFRFQAFGLPAQSGGLGFGGWDSLTSDQWSNLTADGWSNLPVNSGTQPGGFRMGWGGKKSYYLDGELELYFLGMGAGGRLYDPVTGKFMSDDPIRYAGGDTTLNRYCGNNPVMMIDPGGRQFLDPLGEWRSADPQANLKEAQQRFNEIVAVLDTTPTRMKKAAESIDSLNKQIANQEKLMNVLFERFFKEARPGSEVPENMIPYVDKLERLRQQLADAKSLLKDLENPAWKEQLNVELLKARKALASAKDQAEAQEPLERVRRFDQAYRAQRDAADPSLPTIGARSPKDRLGDIQEEIKEIRLKSAFRTNAIPGITDGIPIPLLHELDMKPEDKAKLNQLFAEDKAIRNQGYTSPRDDMMQAIQQQDLNNGAMLEGARGTSMPVFEYFGAPPTRPIMRPAPVEVVPEQLHLPISAGANPVKGPLAAPSIPPSAPVVRRAPFPVTLAPGEIMPSYGWQSVANDPLGPKILPGITITTPGPSLGIGSKEPEPAWVGAGDEAPKLGSANSGNQPPTNKPIGSEPEQGNLGGGGGGSVVPPRAEPSNAGGVDSANPNEAPKVFKNQFPNDPIGKPVKTFRPSELLKERSIICDYVVMEDGGLIVGKRVPNVTGHIDLAQGKPVLAAGQLEVSGGKIIEMDNASGHYLPKGPYARQAALDAFRRNGFNFGDDVYVEKAWNPKTSDWEPIHGIK